MTDAEISIVWALRIFKRPKTNRPKNHVRSLSPSCDENSVIGQVIGVARFNSCVALSHIFGGMSLLLGPYLDAHPVHKEFFCRISLC